MTFKEYQKLVKEHGETDSIKCREAIESKVFNTACKLVVKLNRLYAKYGQAFIEDDDYREDRGGFSLDMVGSDSVMLIYYDSWQYGGECEFGVTVQMKYLDEPELVKLEEELKAKRIKALEASVKHLEESLELVGEELNKARAELKQLK